ncbi:hypothetical protein [Vagococcus fluvialis]|uniref:hypothetical protein n=1 Tax=Vagococcus fluvialis TaxID=2738 RepID=UPI001D0B3625|nr:hypothetical protein [Vagococcus fluvialis]UDM74063.1 hypothetical protein K5K99_00035 [Vagococcus fluvialis]
MKRSKKKQIKALKNKKPKNTLVMTAIESMIQEFGKQIMALSMTYYEKTKVELESIVKSLEKDAVKSKEKLGFYHLSLAALIYKERFNEEIKIEGIEVDAKGNITYPSVNNVSSNI